MVSSTSFPESSFIVPDTAGEVNRGLREKALANPARLYYNKQDILML